MVLIIPPVIDVDIFIYVNILINEVLQKRKFIKIKTLPNLYIECSSIVHISHLRLSEYIKDITITSFNYVPSNKIAMNEVTDLFGALLNVNLKKICIKPKYTNYDRYISEKSLEITGTGINLTVTVKDFLIGVYSLKQYLSYEYPEYIRVVNLEYYDSLILFNILYSGKI